MAESCTSCGKTLTFRDNFEWKGKKVCKSCLKSFKREAAPEPQVKKKKKSKKEELTPERMNKDIRNWGIALIVLGAIHLAASEFLDASWGIVIIILGIVNLFVRKKEMFIVNGIALICVGIMNISSGIDAGGRWAFFGIMQMIWGGQEIYKFVKYKRLGDLTPTVPANGIPETAAPVSREPITGELSSIQDYKMLFDKDRLGINFYLGGALIIAYSLATFIWQIPGAVFQGESIRFYLTGIILFFNVIAAAAFLFVHYRFFTNLKTLALINGGFVAAIDLVQEIIMYQNIHQMDPNYTFRFETVLIGFVWGFLFVYLLAETIKRGGLDLKTLVAGMIVLQFAGNIASTIIYMILRPGFEFHWHRLITVVLTGAVYGVLIYYGFVLHLKKHSNSYSQ